MICPLCGERRARRGCPALSQQICSVCCGTKRLVEIPCPSDCAYLATARGHPAAATVRQQQRDVASLTSLLRDLNERQSHLFFLIATFLLRHEPAQLPALIDEDVAGAAAALASTYETASRGVIYEHRPASLPAARLAASLDAMLAEGRRRAPALFERDAAVVLRRIEESARSLGPVGSSGGTRAFFDLLARVIRPQTDSDSQHPESPASEAPRLIVP